MNVYNEINIHWDWCTRSSSVSPTAFHNFLRNPKKKTRDIGHMKGDADIEYLGF